MSSENDEQNSAEVTCPRCEGCGQLANSDEREPWSVWMALPVGSALAVTMGLVKPEPCDECGGTGKAAGERRALSLTGEGNPEPEPLRSVIDYLTDAAWRVNWKPDDKHPLQARYDALRSLMSIYAYATLVSLETLQRTDPGAADRVAEHLSHDDWDSRAECALLWHESLTGGARYAPFDEELHLLAGHHDLAIRQSAEVTQPAISDAMADAALNVIARGVACKPSCSYERHRRDEMRAALQSAYPAIRQQVAEEIAVVLDEFLGKPAGDMAAEITRRIGRGESL